MRLFSLRAPLPSWRDNNGLSEGNPMLKGKTALVTGSTSGIGLGIATRLAAEGANVVLNGFGDASLIEKLKKELTGKNGVKVAYDPADMTKPGEIAAMVQKAIAEFGA